MKEILFHLGLLTRPRPKAHVFREERRNYHGREFTAAGVDDFGLVYRLAAPADKFSIAVDVGRETTVYRYIPSLGMEIWAFPGQAALYHVRPAQSKGDSREYYERIKDLIPDAVYLPDTDVAADEPRPYPLGAIPLRDGTVSFGLFHPTAARVYLAGDFNDWQHPGRAGADPDKFLPMELYRGYYDQPNLWLLRVGSLDLRRRQEYSFYVQGGTALNDRRRPERYQVDPYARAYGRDFELNNAVIVDPGRYRWQDLGWRTPPVNDLVIYEMSVYGLTQEAPGVPPEEQGTFAGVARQIERGYFRDLGVNILALMPTAEAPTIQGPHTLGYDPCGFMAIERDFGSPDDFRRLVDTAHLHGLGVICDQVFNHTANSFNPLWGAIADGTPGGFYFSGDSPWGNRVATEREEVQNMLIDACKLLIKEYHVDGFRFDATNSIWVDHGFLRRLAHVIKDYNFKPDCLLVAENLPNESDLNLEGYNGYAQWCDPFHDKIKALLREGTYNDWMQPDPEHLGRIFYFSKDFYAAHTNNVVNYCESHDENSVSFEIATNPEAAADPGDRSDRARLGLFAALTALGQPMLYMGQEFGVDRPRNLVIFDWPGNPDEDPFFTWTRRLIHLRREHPALRVSGYNPAAEGRFSWLAGPWREPGLGRKIIAWRTNDGGEEMAVVINFETEDIQLDLPVGLDAVWRRVADLKEVDEENGPVYKAVGGFLDRLEVPGMSGMVLLRQ